MKPLQEIRRTALDKVLPEEYFALELSRFMTDLREVANRVRMDKTQQWARGELMYHVGRIHGLWYGMASQLIFTRGNSIYDECSELAEAARHEAAYLTECYVFGSAS